MEQKQPTKEMILASQKHYSSDGFWTKVKEVAKKAGTKVIYAALVLYYTATADSTPMAKKSIIYGALGYFILPIDLIPDVIPVVGFSDDLAALIAAATAVSSSITPAIKEEAKAKLEDWFGTVDKKDLNIF